MGAVRSASGASRAGRFLYSQGACRAERVETSSDLFRNGPGDDGARFRRTTGHPACAEPAATDMRTELFVAVRQGRILVGRTQGVELAETGRVESGAGVARLQTDRDTQFGL